MQRTYQKMGLVKYDAFNEMGGKLSFSLAMLDVKIMDLSLMRCTQERAVILILKKSLMEIQ